MSSPSPPPTSSLAFFLHIVLLQFSLGQSYYAWTSNQWVLQIGGCDINNHVSEGASSFFRIREKQFEDEGNDSYQPISTSGSALVCDSDPYAHAEFIRNVTKYQAIWKKDWKAPLGNVTAVMISVSDAEILTPFIDDAVDAGIIVVTFEGDAPDSKRHAFVGTNNTFMGEQIAINLEQILPEGGTYALVAAPTEKNRARAKAVQNRLSSSENKKIWTESPQSPLWEPMEKYNFTQNAQAFRKMQSLLQEDNITALIPLDASYMESPYWEEWIDGNRQRNFTIVSGDGTPVQIAALLRNYAQGLVGQIPWEVGITCAKIISDLVDGRTLDQEIFGTNVIEHTKIPYVLPELTVDHNLLQGLSVLGFACFGIIAASCLAASIWTYRNRQVYVVKSSQPLFLMMISVGVFLLGSTLIPLSLDDSDNLYDLEESRAVGMCMSIPWVAWTGFTTTFAALFSKTWRINRLLNTKGGGLRRVEVTEKDVLPPFFALLAVNFLILLLWTLLDPLKYVRQDLPGTDGWNRVIATYGSCRSNDSKYYLSALVTVNMGVLAVANWQAYKAKSLESEFAESKYIGLTMLSLFQAMLIGFPALFLVRDNPQAFYVLLVLLIFVLCMVTLALLFGPKIVSAHIYKGMSNQEQARFVRDSIRRTSMQQQSQPNSRARFLRRSGTAGSTNYAMSGSFDNFDLGPSSTNFNQQQSSGGRTSSHLGSNSNTRAGSSDTFVLAGQPSPDISSESFVTALPFPPTNENDPSTTTAERSGVGRIGGSSTGVSSSLTSSSSAGMAQEIAGATSSSSSSEENSKPHGSGSLPRSNSLSVHEEVENEEEDDTSRHSIIAEEGKVSPGVQQPMGGESPSPEASSIEECNV